MGFPEVLKGLGSEATLATGALNAELMGSVFVAAEGAAAGLGKFTEEFPNVLPPNPEDPVEPVGAPVGLETPAEGAAEGLGNPAEGVADGLGIPAEGVADGLGNPEVAGAAFFSGSGALNAELIGFTGSVLGAALAAGVVGLANPPALGNPAEGVGFSLGSGALNAELMGSVFVAGAGSALGADAAGAAGVVGLANPPALGKPAEGAAFALGSGALNAELIGSVFVAGEGAAFGT